MNTPMKITTNNSRIMPDEKYGYIRLREAFLEDTKRSFKSTTNVIFVSIIQLYKAINKQ